MNHQLPYRLFPTLDDIRRVGLLLGTPETSAASTPELFEINAAAGKSAPRTLRPGHRHDQSRVGEINEVQFGLDAMRHDFICGKPETVEAFDLFVVPRDFVRLPVLSPDLGKRPRRISIAPVALVQVRSTMAPIMQKRALVPYYHVSARHTHVGRPYKPGEIDIIAAYIEPLKLWYIIPYEEVGSRMTISLFPHDPKSTGRYEKFKERWDLLRL
jgi:hypothetical protein